MKQFLYCLTFMFGFVPNSVFAKSYVIKGVSYPEPEAIDLGLPSGNKWANMNIGASSVNEIGGYYGWADPTGELTYESYNWRSTTLDGAWNSPLFGGTNPPRDISGTELDIATNKLGTDWCMPSSDDFKELTENCSFEVLDTYVRVIGPNGKSIKLPISGKYSWHHVWHRDTEPHDEIWFGQSMTWAPCFWASTRSDYNNDDDDAQYNYPAADYAAANANGFQGACGTCDSWYRNGMTPIRAIKRRKCATPTIAFVNGRLKFSCETEEVTYAYTITPNSSSGSSTNGEISLTMTFNVRVYAQRESYLNSEVSTTTINLADVGDMNGDGKLSVEDVTKLVDVIMKKE